MIPFLLLFSLACKDGGDVDDSQVTGTDDTQSGDDTGAECLEASAPTALTLVGEATPLTAPTLTWTEPVEGCAQTVEIQLALGDGSDPAAWLDWTAVTQPWDGSLSTPLPLEGEVVASLRAVDALGNQSEAVSASFTMWSPSALEGMVAWYDFADTDTLLGTGCSAPAAEGEVIHCVDDKSGNGNDLSDADAGEGYPDFDGPLRTTLNGRAAADFHGQRLLWVPDNDSIGFQAPGMVAVWVDAPSRVNDYTGEYPLNKEGAYEFAYREGQLKAAIETEASGRWEWGTVDPGASPELQLNAFVYDGTNWVFRRNAEPLGLMSPAGNQTGLTNAGYYELHYGGQTFVITETPLVIGGRPLGNTVSYEAVQGELLLFDQVPTGTDLNLLERQLMEKWQIATE